MRWTEVQIATTLEAEEAVANLFYEAGAQGVVIESVENLIVLEDDPTVNYVDENLLEMDPNESLIRGYFSEEQDTDESVHKLLTGIRHLPEFGLDPGESELTITEMEENDWENSWKQYYKPTKVGKEIVIVPTWEDYTPEAGEILIQMDPGMAFGTGTHETTQLCVAKLEETVKAGDTVLDIGCGTGILSIVAEELGAGKVVAVDFDPVAVKVAGENVVRNGADKVVEIREGNLTEVIRPEEKADVVVANILAEAIIELSATVDQFLKPAGYFISSGIINDRLEAVVDALDDKYRILGIEQLGEWNCILAQLR